MPFTDIRTVGINVADQDAALTFYTERLAFGVQTDRDTPAGRWLVVAVGQLLEWDGTPPMFSFQDLDGNTLDAVEDWS